MFGLRLDLSELQKQSDELTASMDAKIEELEKSMPQLKIRAHLEQLTKDFTEMPFMPLDDVWKEELDDIFKEMED
jgi:hypothetical protein